MLIQLTFPAIFFHPINAFEENGYLVLDAPMAEQVVENYNFLDTVDRSEKQYSVQLSNTPPTVPMRYVLPLDVPKASLILRKSKILKMKSGIGQDAKSWLVAPNTVFVHPEYLVSPLSVVSSYRQFEFPTLHPSKYGREYR